MKRTHSITVGTLVLGILISGCGGKGTSQSSSTSITRDSIQVSRDSEFNTAYSWAFGPSYMSGCVWTFVKDGSIGQVQKCVGTNSPTVTDWFNIIGTPVDVFEGGCLTYDGTNCYRYVQNGSTYDYFTSISGAPLSSDNGITIIQDGSNYRYVDVRLSTIALFTPHGTPSAMKNMSTSFAYMSGTDLYVQDAGSGSPTKVTPPSGFTITGYSQPDMLLSVAYLATNGTVQKLFYADGSNAITTELALPSNSTTAVYELSSLTNGEKRVALIDKTNSGSPKVYFSTATKLTEFTVTSATGTASSIKLDTYGQFGVLTTSSSAYSFTLP